MALTPSHEDPNREEVMKHIASVEKKGTAQAEEQLKEEFNKGDKQSTVVVSPAAAEKLVKNK